jgi:hypothetical protein
MSGQLKRVNWAQDQPAPAHAIRVLKVNFPQVRNLGIYVCRNIKGTKTKSAHAEGRALDIGLRADRPAEKVIGDGALPRHHPGRSPLRHRQRHLESADLERGARRTQAVGREIPERREKRIRTPTICMSNGRGPEASRRSSISSSCRSPSCAPASKTCPEA